MWVEAARLLSNPNQDFRSGGSRTIRVLGELELLGHGTRT